MLAAALVGFDLARGGHPLSAGMAPPVPKAAAPTSARVEPSAASQPMVVQAGSGTFAFASGPGSVVGQVGPVVLYRVAVEDGTGVPLDTFATRVEAILGDPRSWTAGGMLRLQRVAGTEPAQFTVYLASPVTSQSMCREDWLETEQYTNCRLNDGRVVINSARWLTAVPEYGAPLETYQAYALNHEVGHQLGFGHELCPGPGEPAPVMQQQTLGLDGCVANGWPYLDGRRYGGPPTDQ
jgi:Protein of unknown function (DUF3152)